ncbi:hypothetical protein SAMN05216553_101424 [Lentzea fradiae]|uniref:CU044_5270 family protein n=1 Tax=Lentzea fradiae TaxID=200378 RepID=A0A1G7KR27_9PSEU|nr:hypothetical protein [Lentzea fradiae]SDF39534.1 hypothetical protein SAMN05216553_101424 [Lentzea fradiae]
MKKLRDVHSPSSEAYDRARGALHSAMGEQMTTVPPPRRRRSWPRLSVAALGAAAVVTAVVIGTTGGGAPATTPADSAAPEAGAAPQVVESPLVELASAVQAAGQLPGDSSLVVKRWAAPDGSPSVHYTVYTDQGQMFYGDSPQSLAEGARRNDDQAQEHHRKAMDAARLAATGDVEKARDDMLASTGAPFGFGTTPEEADKAWQESYERRAAEFRRLGKEVPPFKPRPTGKEFEDLLNNQLWASTTSALFSGASNADVRAGVLKLLATIGDVKVEKAEAGGRQVLTLTGSPAIHGGDGHAVLTVSAETGLPISSEIVPNPLSPEPSKAAIVRYESSRVTLDDVKAGRI